MTQGRELRIYLLDERMNPLPNRLTGQVTVWTDQKMETTTLERKLEGRTDGAYIFAKIPENAQLPLRARFNLNRKEGPGTQLIDFYIGEIIDPEGADIRPAK